MQSFRFKLAAKLRLAENALDEMRICLAEEQHKLSLKLLQLETQQAKLQEAVDGQNCATVPDRGLWHLYADRQYREFIQCQQGYDEQSEIVDTVRDKLLEKHKEVKKLQRLKEKQALGLALARQRLEQYSYDEIAQTVFSHNTRRLAMGEGA